MGLTVYGHDALESLWEQSLGFNDPASYIIIPEKKKDTHEFTPLKAVLPLLDKPEAVFIDPGLIRQRIRTDLKRSLYIRNCPEITS